MIKFIKNYCENIDERGSLIGLINFGTWEEINIITSKKGALRGNHFHKYTSEIFIILEGEIEVSVNKIGKKDIEKYLVKKGDVFLIKPMVNHVFEVKKDSKWINVLNKKINSTSPDIHRI